MSSTTTNFNLHKIDLADSPPDITVLNQNFDIIDEKLNEHDNLTASDVGALPIDGSVAMSGALLFANGFAKLAANNTLAGINSYVDADNPTNAYRSILIHSGSDRTPLKNAIHLADKPEDGGVTYYSIFGEHNKPSGSYTGNGSATGRTITTNAIGDAILVWRADTHVMTLVSPKGAIVGQTSGVKYIASTYVYVNSYNLVMATTDTALNESGKTYYYKVL